VTGGTPIVNPQHLRDNVIKPSVKVSVAPKTVSRLSAFVISEGDVVLARRGEMGRCALVGARESGWLLGTGSLALRPVVGVDGAYLTWLLRSPQTVRHLEEQSVGTTMTNLNQTILLELPVPLPPAAEQLRIVQEIERLFSVIDKLEVIVETQRTRCARERQAILKWAFDGKLVDQNPDDASANKLVAQTKAVPAVASRAKKRRDATIIGTK
jgi:type I restriction enzyme S subunit